MSVIVVFLRPLGLRLVLLCLAALAAGVATSSAQVYSLNVVGYINVVVPANQYVLIANQLSVPDTTIATLLPNMPDTTILQKLGSSGLSAYVYDAAFTQSWTPDGNATLNPGEGAFFLSPSATTLTFVGEVLQGTRTNTLPIGSYAIRSSIVPQQGTPTTLLIPPEDTDTLQTLGPSGLSAYVYDAAFTQSWTPSEPTIAVGQSFFYQKAATSTQSLWIRTFNVQ